MTLQHQDQAADPDEGRSQRGGRADAGAALQAKQLGLTRAYVLGGGTRGYFSAEFETSARKLGIRLVGSRGWAFGKPRSYYAALAERVARARPDGVYLAGLGDSAERTSSRRCATDLIPASPCSRTRAFFS